LWEERLVLIKAPTEEQARRRAEQIGKDAEHEYDVRNKKIEEVPQKLKWTFEQIERVYQVESESLADGTEIFSRFLRDSEVKSLLTPFEDE
jgi:hypothetical protein